MPQEAIASFEYLVGKIRQVYPSLLRKEFKLCWKDDEGEYVAFSSDEELVMALGSADSKDHFRIYIEISKDSADGLSGENKSKHPGVVCDVCDKDIEGTRFKCLSCPDYDLCGACEAKGFHPEHEMLRIRTPGRHPMQGFWQFMFGPGSRGRHGGGGCPRRSRHGGPHHPKGPHGAQSHHGPPEWAKHCQGGAGMPGFFSPWGCAGSQKNPASEKTEEDKKEKQQEDGTPIYPTLQEIIGNLSQAFGESFSAAGPYSWGFDPENENQTQTKEKDQTTEKDKKEPEAERKDVDGDSQMPQSESFVVVDKSAKEAEPSAPPSQAEQRRYQAEEFERKLNEAIKQMEGMGFQNDNGWLNQLLIAKDFDIGKVIDTLESSK